MEKVKIYLSGAMTGMLIEEQKIWRSNIVNAVKFGDYSYDKKPIFFNPVEYYNFEEENYSSEKEIMEFDLYNLRKSDVVIVNFNNPSSIGTAMELILAKERHIPIIAFGVKNQNIHPWLLECCTKICDNIRIKTHIIMFVQRLAY